MLEILMTVVYTILGSTHCGINVHLLLHVPFYVKCFGPLWTHSAFGFEGQMHNFLKCSHATHGVEKQVHVLAICK